jgi:hypothetical protein
LAGEATPTTDDPADEEFERSAATANVLSLIVDLTGKTAEFD